MDSDSESKLISLISQLITIMSIMFKPTPNRDHRTGLAPKTISLIIQVMKLVRGMDLPPKPETKLMSLVTQTVSLFNSRDLDSLPEPLWKFKSLLSLFSQKVSIDTHEKPEADLKFTSLVDETLELKPDSEEISIDSEAFGYLLDHMRKRTDPELMSLDCQIVSIVNSMNSEWRKLICLCPQLQLSLDEGKFHVIGEVKWEESRSYFKWDCFIGDWEKLGLTRGEDATHFLCRGCNGEYHTEYEKAPLEIKHPLHQKHSLQLALKWGSLRTIKCYCCDEDLRKVFYYCSTCDYAMNIACVEKPRLLSIPPTKWHEHTLALFPSQTSLPCNVCALQHSACPFYICPPCDFVVHQRCMSLPRVIRISRHPHRISFTPFFDQGDWSCRLCRIKINNDYGGYSCIKNDCSYVAHSRCATQSNVWDGTDLEGEPEEIEEEEVEPFVRIGDGIIQHFSHEHHHLRLGENTSRDYDEKRQCHACITPIYFGNFYSCVQCEFVLHETCANLSRKLYHPTHPHLFTLALREVNDDNVVFRDACAACDRFVTVGFFYKCGKEECHFKLHVQCATISEPLVREGHVHPLFLTSKPGERRRCTVCERKKFDNPYTTTETFNCIECDDFAMCFECAVIPEKVRYKHDKHILTLSYGEETSMVTYWCEACETKVNPKEGFYMCREYCCVTLHIECLIGRDLYMKPGSSYFYRSRQLSVMPNNHHMSQPFCSICKRRCSDKIFFQCSLSIFCSVRCTTYMSGPEFL